MEGRVLLVLQHSTLVALVVHSSVAVHVTLHVHHTRLGLLNELLLPPWHTLAGPICHLGLPAGVVGPRLLVGLGWVV